MTDTESQSEAAVPAIMTVWDVLNWIAFKELRPRPEMVEEHDQSSRWGNRDLHLVLEALEARASSQPYHVLDPLLMDDQYLGGKRYHCLESRVGPQRLRWIRRKARRREGRLVTFPELHEMLQKELPEIEEKSSRRANALTILTDAIRSGKLDTWALQGTSGCTTEAKAIHAKVDPNVFLSNTVSLTNGSTIGANLAHPFAVFNYYQGPQYREVRFRREDVLARWRPDPSTHAHDAATMPKTAPAAPPAVSRRARGRGGALVQYDWDAFWIEAMIWTERNGFGERDRRRLQALMMKWRDEHQLDQLHDATIRAKIKLVYDEVKARETAPAAPPAMSRRARGRSGALVQYDWDAFWIEAMIWTERNGFGERDRRRLQALMMKWRDEHQLDELHDATIQAKIKLVYDEVKARTQRVTRG